MSEEKINKLNIDTENTENHTPHDLNDTSDIDMSKLQYTSTTLDKMIEDGVYDSLCNLVRAVKLADKSDNFLVREIKKRYSSYCPSLNPLTFKRWVEYYKELREAYYFGRDMALGELLSIGMKAARKDTSGEYALKLIDRLDTGLISPKNSIENKTNGNNSNETTKTLGKLVLELNNVEEPKDEEGVENES